MTNIKDVAKKAGVSVSTVSHVINKTRFVNEQTQAKVLATMENLQYHPNSIARSLRRKDKRTHTIGLLIPDSTNPFFAEVLKGVEDVSFGAGFNVFLCNSDGNPQKETDYIEALLRKQIDGIILVSAGIDPNFNEYISQRKIPLIIVDREIEGINFNSVMIDNHIGGYLATSYLTKLGHRRIGCITGPSVLTPSAYRIQGYRQALEEKSITLDHSLIIQGDFRAQSGRLATKQILTLTVPPTAIFACNDMMAVGAIRAIYEAGLKVPDDISVIGFDDILLASFIVPSLTTISQPSHEMGLLAAELVIKQIQNPQSPPQHIILSPSLIIRDSCQHEHREIS